MRKNFFVIMIAAVTLAMPFTAYARTEISRQTTGNGYTAYYDDGSYLVYNARGDEYTFYDPYGNETDWDGNQTERQSDSIRREQADKYRYAEVTNAHWSGKTAKWSADERSSATFTITLYRDGHKVTSKTSKGGSSHNFSSNITRDGYYSFEVHAKWPGGYMDDDDSDEKYFSAGTSGNNTVSSAGPGVSGPGVSNGWQYIGNAWKYRKPDGNYAANAWEYINGKWYKFDTLGNMLANQWVLGAKWYYLGPDGDMYVNQWVQSVVNPHIWYYVGPDGGMVTNQYVGQWYVNENGECWV